MSAPKRPVPADFIAMREKLGSILNLTMHYRANKATVARWIKELGLPPGRRLIPVPDDFVVRREALRGVRNLSAYYGVSHDVVRRWIRELGLPDLRKDEAHRARGHETGGMRKGGFRMPPTSVATVQRLNNYGPHDEAADILRPHAPVYRCDESGRADAKGGFWRVGQVVCDGNELLARAERVKRRRAA